MMCMGGQRDVVHNTDFYPKPLPDYISADLLDLLSEDADYDYLFEGPNGGAAVPEEVDGIPAAALPMEHYHGNNLLNENFQEKHFHHTRTNSCSYYPARLQMSMASNRPMSSPKSRSARPNFVYSLPPSQHPQRQLRASTGKSWREDSLIEDNKQEINLHWSYREDVFDEQAVEKPPQRCTSNENCALYLHDTDSMEDQHILTKLQSPTVRVTEQRFHFRKEELQEELPRSDVEIHQQGRGRGAGGALFSVAPAHALTPGPAAFSYLHQNCSTIAGAPSGGDEPNWITAFGARGAFVDGTIGRSGVSSIGADTTSRFHLHGLRGTIVPKEPLTGNFSTPRSGVGKSAARRLRVRELEPNPKWHEEGLCS
ncbi:unnamed protein product [Amoebophrya sp. A120]|nr:unnamed protein product [Amoebophrya sp. A120]|eukprot:GSA120T00008983001.1